LSDSIQEFSEKLQKLVSKFQADQDYYLSGDYLEAQVRVDFITPLFKALGWDVENEAGLAHHQREVIVERGESETTGRPDYNFRIGGQTKFFVEAKAPSETLSNPHHILQAKGYVWNTRQVFFVILTDFVEFRFYDASRQPDERNPDDGLLLKLKYGDYLSSLEKLWEFSKERVAAGSLDALLPKARRAPHLRKQVDDVFLDEMTGWREELAKDIHKRNPALTAKQLNEVVQRLLDRIVFIRIAEDRHVIEKRQLAEVVEEWETHGGKFPIFDWLNDLFHKINEDFNGEIFKPHLSEEIQIDSEILARIIKRLYPPQSPYRFDVIGVELLGSIYERYLGNTIRLTPKQVRVEEKPEVRKAGGVYYTPKYIVDYIVKNTVGKVIEGKTPKQIEKIRILDPACGSGSFLIGAFQYLIDYHTQWYLEHPEQEVRHAHPSLDFMREVHTDPDGTKRLSVYRKAKILRNNLFGVDIDPQAVEITMMSLYLKALEGEQSQLPPKQHLLPELKYNIQCGNSLIGPDIYDQGVLFAEDERDRINAFDWDFVAQGPLSGPAGLPAQGEFGPCAVSENDRIGAPRQPRRARKAARLEGEPCATISIGQVMGSGGFDVVIGNPPYVRQESISQFKGYFQTHYKSFDGVADLYVYFMEKGLRLLREGGYYSIIVSSSFLRTNFAEPLRAFLKKAAAPLRIVDFGGLAVFENAKDTYVCIPLLAKQKQPERVQVARIASLDFDDLDGCLGPALYTIPHQRLTPEAWSLKSDAEAAVFEKIMKARTPLGKYVEGRMFYGIKTGLNEAFVLSEKEWKAILAESPAARPLIKRFLGGQNILRYYIEDVRQYLVVVPCGWTRQEMSKPQKKARPTSEKEAWSRFSDEYSGLAKHLAPFAEACRKRQDQGDYWWELRPCDYYGYFDGPKIIFPDICKGPRFYADDTDLYLANTAYCLGTGDRYLLGILNSRLFWFAISNISIPFGIRAGEYRYRLIYQYMERVPIRPINFSDPADKARHDKMVVLVERMLELNRQKHSGKLAPSQVERVDREFAATDAEIDNLVYELYGIPEEEREIIEGT
jgi:type I restriction-modification system DNA methylase subunit